MITNDPFSIAFTDLSAYEDAEQAATLSRQPIVLHYVHGRNDLDFRVLRGPFRGQDVEEVSRRIRRGHQQAGRQVTERYSEFRPWWRLWRPTWALRITVREPLTAADICQPLRREPRIGEVWMYGEYACRVTADGFEPLDGVTKVRHLDLTKAEFLAGSVAEALHKGLL